MNKSVILFAIITFLFPSLVRAGGVGLGMTRLVYHAKDKQTSLNIRNTDVSSPFLIQAWLSDFDGIKTQDFVVIPPLSILRPNKENTLRIIFKGKGLPTDKESLYWLTVKAIPQSVNQDRNTLQLAAASRIKVFYRPTGLSESISDAYQKITGSLNKGKLILNNPTAYYVTLITLKVDGKEISPLMLAPKTDVIVRGEFNSAKNFSYQTINDYGAWTTLISKRLN